jgi:hypothetical protein
MAAWCSAAFGSFLRAASAGRQPAIQVIDHGVEDHLGSGGGGDQPIVRDAAPDQVGRDPLSEERPGAGHEDLVGGHLARGVADGVAGGLLQVRDQIPAAPPPVERERVPRRHVHGDPAGQLERGVVARDDRHRLVDGHRGGRVAVDPMVEWHAQVEPGRQDLRAATQGLAHRDLAAAHPGEAQERDDEKGDDDDRQTHARELSGPDRTRGRAAPMRANGPGV